MQMAFFHLLSVVLVGYLIPVTRSQDSAHSCPKDWMYLAGSCYQFSSKSLGWAAAQTACEDMGSTLAVVDSKEKQTAIAANLKGLRHWIGLYRDPEEPSRWLWVDWSRLCNGCGYWFTGEPNNQGGREGCGEMWPQRSGGWNDVNCSTKRRYICQKRACPTFEKSEDEPSRVKREELE